MTLNYVTLVLDAYDGQGNVVTKGSASFVPSAQLADPGVEWIPQAPVPAVFHSAGLPSVKLLATDNSAPLPNGWTWGVAFDGVPGSPAEFSFFLPYSGGSTQYLSDLVPVSSGTVFAASLPLPSGNPVAVKVLNPSGGDDTAAFDAALAALPTVTLTTGGNSPTTQAVPYGTIILGAGTFQFGAVSDTSNIGPCVNLIGMGRNATTVTYHGAGDALRMFCPVVSADRAFDLLPALHGRIDGFTIDGTSASAGASGLHYGDTEGGVLGPDLMVANFSQGLVSTPTGLAAAAVGSGGTFASNTYFWGITAITRTGETTVSSTASATIVLNGSANLTWTAATGATGYRIYRGTSSSLGALVATVGAVTAYTDTGTAGYTAPVPPTNHSGNVGLWLDNTKAWTEALYGRVILRNNSTNCMFSVQADAGADIGPSFEYNDLTFKVYAFPKQNGIVLREGAWFENGSLRMRANFANSNAAQSNAALTVTGVVPALNIKAGQYSQITDCHLDLQCETNSLNTGSGTNYPSTVMFGDVNNNKIVGSMGVLAFQLPANWSGSNYSSSNKYSLQFIGTILGDANLNPANDSHIVYTGGLTLSQGKFPSTTTFRASSGDVFSTVLTGSVTVAFDTFFTVAAPQRKTIFIQQAASGGPFTVAWPKPGSPSLSSPAVYWPAGSAPTQSTGASAIDKYVLETVDGIHWYGTQSQAFS